MSQIRLSQTALIALTAEQIFSAHHPDWSRDDLLCHPKQAMRLCDLVRAQMSNQLPDHEILGAYVKASRRNALAFLRPRRRRE